MKKLIVDIDTGIDDAMALVQGLYAHRTGKAQILAITAVQGNAAMKDVVRNTYRILELCRTQDIPVHRGSYEAMVVPFDNQEAYHGTNGFNDIKFDSLPDTSRVSNESAVDAIRRIVAAHPGEVTMLCLAPLTNLALALKVDPSLSSHLKEVVLMGGNIEGMGNTAMSVAAEFNFLADPEAAFVVLNCASPCPVTIISWELCFKYFNIPMEWRKKKLGVTETTQAELFNRLEQPWFDNYDFDPEVWMLCDQVAMAVVLNPGLVKESRRKRATVELAGHLSRGNMLLEWRPYIERTEDFKPNVVVINRVDEEAFMQDLLRAFQFKF